MAATTTTTTNNNKITTTEAEDAAPDTKANNIDATITAAADDTAAIKANNKIIAAAADGDDLKNDMKKNRIQVSNTKRPLFFYLNLAKRYIKQHKDVELSALGMAIPTVVIIAEILKRNGLAIETKISTSTVGTKDEARGRMVQKAKIEVVLAKPETVDADQKAAA